MEKKPYKTLIRRAEQEFVINKSRFIGHGAPAETEEEALAFLKEMREKYKDATHNCYAYIIGLNMGTMRYSDDGEPGGTAGMPIIEVMKARGVTNCAVVVTRYFGGVLLGAGGLVRAYTRSASDAVEAAGLVSMEPCTQFSVAVPYAFRNAVWSVFERFGAIERADYGESIRCAFRCRTSEADAFLKALTERTEGRITAAAQGEGYFGFPVGNA